MYKSPKNEYPIQNTFNPSENFDNTMVNEDSALNLEELYQYQPPLIYNNETLILETGENLGFMAFYPDSKPAPLTGVQPEFKKGNI